MGCGITGVEYARRIDQRMWRFGSVATTVAERGYITPTPIQAQTIPHLLTGHDVLWQAGEQFGSSLTVQDIGPVLNRQIQGDDHGLTLIGGVDHFESQFTMSAVTA